ncbi:hypothetical protein L0F63_001612 [Massospora cicadina]|nr:hypothetical protein L0F63_001612 [Massospora cicadina]
MLATKGCLCSPPAFLLYGDRWTAFTCKLCSPIQKEDVPTFPDCTLMRDVYRKVILFRALNHLTLKHQLYPQNTNQTFFHAKDIIKLVDETWDVLCIGKTRTPTWGNTVSSTLSISPQWFRSGAKHMGAAGYWSLVERRDAAGMGKLNPELLTAQLVPLRPPRYVEGVGRVVGSPVELCDVPPDGKDLEPLDPPKKKRGRKPKERAPDFCFGSPEELYIAPPVGKELEQLDPPKKKRGRKPKERGPVPCFSLPEEPYTSCPPMEKNSSGNGPPFLQFRQLGTTLCNLAFIWVDSFSPIEPTRVIFGQTIPLVASDKGLKLWDLPFGRISSALDASLVSNDADSSFGPPLPTSNPPGLSEVITSSPILTHNGGLGFEGLRRDHVEATTLDLIPGSPRFNSEERRKSSLGASDSVSALSNGSPPASKAKGSHEQFTAGSRVQGKPLRPLDPLQEWELLQRLQNSSAALPPAARRLMRKLALNRSKDLLGIPRFNIDRCINRYLQRQELKIEPCLPPVKGSGRDFESTASPKGQEPVMFDCPLAGVELCVTPWERSFASRLYGSVLSTCIAMRVPPRVSPYHGTVLKPLIWRISSLQLYRWPAKLRLLVSLLRGDIRLQPPCDTPRRCAKRFSLPSKPQPITEGDRQVKPLPMPIDFCYLLPQHLPQVNQLLSRLFWTGIDMSESLQYPDYSIVVVYGRLVIGCAFMTPTHYITYLAIAPGWQGCGLGKVLLYLLVRKSNGHDVTLHVSTNNPALLLYQQFGFKAEQFLVNFYDKYIPPNSALHRNAFFVRLRQN